jgi:hypothetical protein
MNSFTGIGTSPMLCGLSDAEPSILLAGVECFTPKGLESPEEVRRIRHETENKGIMLALQN